MGGGRAGVGIGQPPAGSASCPGAGVDIPPHQPSCAPGSVLRVALGFGLQKLSSGLLSGGSQVPSLQVLETATPVLSQWAAAVLADTGPQGGGEAVCHAPEPGWDSHRGSLTPSRAPGGREWVQHWLQGYLCVSP